MDNVLTAVRQTAYGAAQVVSRERVGIIGSIVNDFNADSAAEGDTIKVPYTPALSTSDYSAGMTTTIGTAQTINAVSMTLNQHKQVTWQLGAEEEQALLRGGDNAQEFFRQSTEQAVRALTNGMESYAWGVAYKGASRAVGTAGTTPFASDIKIANDVLQILEENGAPREDISLCIDSAAANNLRDLVTITNDSNVQSMRDTGMLVPLSGMDVKVSAGVGTHTTGTGSGYLINKTAGYSAGDTSLEVDTGSGTILAGDVVTFTTGGTIKYVVGTALSSGSLAINRPGLKTTLDNNDIVTLETTNWTGNVALHRQAVVMTARAPRQVVNANIESMPISDPISGLTMLMERIAGDGVSTYRVRVLYAAMAVQPEHIALLLG